MAKRLIVIMGPSGCGKSSTARALADALGIPMLEGDDFHPRCNVAKMAAGQPLSDKDREAWLDRIEAEVTASPRPKVVLACSALTAYVQERLRLIADWVPTFFLLDAPREVLEQRMGSRADHFMPPSLLDSQLAALKAPHDAVLFDADQDVTEIVAQMVAALNDEA